MTYDRSMLQLSELCFRPIDIVNSVNSHLRLEELHKEQLFSQ